MKMSHGKNTKNHMEKRNLAYFLARKAQKREEALARNSAWEKLSTEEKLKILETRPGNCAKQKKKLLK